MSKLDLVFDHTLKLPTISNVVYELVELTRNDDVELAEVVRRVREDQAIAAKVIRVANSSYYMERRKVATVERAVRIIGLMTLRTTVITAGVMNAFIKVPGVKMEDYWRHVLTSGFMAMEMALALDADPEEAFTAAIMQGLGILMLHLRLPEDAMRIAERVPTLEFEARIPLEREMLGFSHNEVTGELLQRWRFPEIICQAISLYPNPQGQSLLGRILFAASHYASGRIAAQPESLIAASLRRKMPDGPTFDENWLGSRKESISKWINSVLS